MAAVGELVRLRRWLMDGPATAVLPARSPAAPGRTLVGRQPCSCGQHGGHMTWTCECGVTVYAPPLSATCRVLHGAAAVR